MLLIYNVRLDVTVVPFTLDKRSGVQLLTHNPSHLDFVSSFWLEKNSPLNQDSPCQPSCQHNSDRPGLQADVEASSID